MKKRWKNRKWHFLKEITPDLIMSIQQRSSNEQEIFTPKPLKTNLQKNLSKLFAFLSKTIISLSS
jgi:hypothetical protein